MMIIMKLIPVKKVHLSGKTLTIKLNHCVTHFSNKYAHKSLQSCGFTAAKVRKLLYHHLYFHWRIREAENSDMLSP